MAVRKQWIVPMEIEALVVNDTVRKEVTFQRWSQDFTDARSNPVDEGAIDNGFGTDPENNGVHLRWVLPEALTHARQHPTSGALELPFVPNRWLVARYLTGKPDSKPAAWLIESDYVGEWGSVMFVRHDTPIGDETMLGRAHDLTAGAWQEPAPRAPHLTAFGPGIVDFAAYQPYQKNVFSFHDDLTGVGESATLSYLVAGWYANGAGDPLTTPNVKDVLRDFGWFRRRRGRLGALNTFCAGTARSVRWRKDDRSLVVVPPSNGMRVAAGTTGVEALTALVRHQHSQLPYSAEVLTTLQHGLSDRLDGTPDGLFEYEQYVHQAGFTRTPGGHQYAVVTVDAPSGTRPVPPPAWLDTLRAAQDSYLTADRALEALRWRLFCLWWLRDLDVLPKAYKKADFTDQLDETRAGSLASEVARARRTRDKALENVPWSPEPRGWETAIAKFLDAKGYSLGRYQKLIRVPLAAYRRAGDPVLLLAGARAGRPLTRGPLHCRFIEDLPSGGVAYAPPPNVESLPAETIKALVGELGALDAGKPSPGLPDFAAATWRQPWSPLYLIWEIDYIPLPFGKHWTFDGIEYRWDGKGPHGPVTALRGRNLLTPHLLANLGNQVRQYREDHPQLPAADIAALTKLLETVAGIDPLSQALGGLTDQVALRERFFGRRPTGALADLIGPAPHHIPNPGNLPGDDGSWPASPFEAIRAGQFRFTRLLVVDAFGQAQTIVIGSDERTTWPILPSSLKPGHAVDEKERQHYVELRPRLVQPARLRFEPVAAPIVGWLLPNFADRALLCFAPDGGGLAELRVARGESGSQRVVAEPLPGVLSRDTGALPPEFARRAPALAATLGGLIASGPDGFAHWWETLRLSLARIEHGEEEHAAAHACLLGRPLAVVRARIALDLDGPPITDPSWQYAFAPGKPEFTKVRWPVRLGEAERLGDGLVGYYTGTAYGTFHAVSPAKGASRYVVPVGKGESVSLAADSAVTELTMIMDPHASVHATTGILPVTTLRLPDELVRDPLAALRPSFRTGPLLTTTRGGAVAVPAPSSHHAGTWEWAETRWEKSETTWAFSPIAAVDVNARLPEESVEIRTGYTHLRERRG
ncbi:hypothetical protein GCM10010193_08110 [Kitasatospora atroaurantiaca]|uniref:Uncharacterized protein n=1 Tax=Kitasatospora atroaurantiaca TaxID=285545 RepID=A0A561EJH8_9ACTN|nr:hypothetical protein [Kitasatospora atroaurantiaca]TWE15768.1 hypothetical protein FB465_0699 [Kitasatospora atroaurantiaca]